MASEYQPSVYYCYYHNKCETLVAFHAILLQFRRNSDPSWTFLKLLQFGNLIDKNYLKMIYVRSVHFLYKGFSQVCYDKIVVLIALVLMLNPLNIGRKFNVNTFNLPCPGGNDIYGLTFKSVNWGGVVMLKFYYLSIFRKMQLFKNQSVPTLPITAMFFSFVDHFRVKFHKIYLQVSYDAILTLCKSFSFNLKFRLPVMKQHSLS